MKRVAIQPDLFEVTWERRVHPFPHARRRAEPWRLLLTDWVHVFPTSAAARAFIEQHLEDLDAQKGLELAAPSPLRPSKHVAHIEHPDLRLRARVYPYGDRYEVRYFGDIQGSTENGWRLLPPAPPEEIEAAFVRRCEVITVALDQASAIQAAHEELNALAQLGQYPFQKRRRRA